MPKNYGVFHENEIIGVNFFNKSFTYRINNYKYIKNIPVDLPESFQNIKKAPQCL